MTQSDRERTFVMEKQHRYLTLCPSSVFAGNQRASIRPVTLVYLLLALGVATVLLPSQARDYFNPASLELTSDAQSTLDLGQFAVDGG
ncbi:hypothetical protein D3C75_1130630 [compost metagenome]|jgi:hypothetical protein